MEWFSDFTELLDVEDGAYSRLGERELLISVEAHPTRLAPGGCVVRVRGDLDATAAPKLGSCLGECVVSPAAVLLDLRSVSFVGCAALAVIEATGAFLGDRRERLVIACNPSVARTLKITGVDRRVTVLAA